jgi:hypothetical protein
LSYSTRVGEGNEDGGRRWKMEIGKWRCKKKKGNEQQNKRTKTKFGKWEETIETNEKNGNDRERKCSNQKINRILLVSYRFL